MQTILGRDPFTLKCFQFDLHEGHIAAIQPSDLATDLWVAPGFVDIQVNGFQGIDCNAAPLKPEQVLQLTRSLAAQGTTTFVPTVITASEEEISKRLESLAAARRSHPEIAHAVPGFHLEGPYISPIDGYRGAHPLDAVRPPSIEEFDRLQRAAGGLIRLVTMSPHWPASPDFIRELVDRGIVVALGHTNASAEQIHAAAHAGATLSTHLGNGIAATLTRHPNPIWSQLAQDSLSASFIADGIHLDGDTLRAMIRCKQVERSVLVSDSVIFAGYKPGTYRSHIGGVVTVHDDGSVRMPGSGLLAGSTITLKDAVARTPKLTDFSLAESLQMATQNPAKLLGLDRGNIKVGATADMVLFRWNALHSTLDIEKVLVRGEAATNHVPLRGDGCEA